MKELTSESGGRHILVVKSLLQTRWSARHDAVKALQLRYKVIMQLLTDLSNDENQSMDTRSDANSLVLSLGNLECAVRCCVFWEDILKRTHHVNFVLQSDKLVMKCVVDQMKFLTTFLKTLRDDFDKYENQAFEMLDSTEVIYHRQNKRNIKRKKRAGEDSISDDVIFSPRGQISH